MCKQMEPCNHYLGSWITCVVVIWPLNAMVRAEKYWMSPDKMEDSLTLSKVCYICTASGLMIYDYLRKNPYSRGRWSIVPMDTHNMRPPRFSSCYQEQLPKNPEKTKKSKSCPQQEVYIPLLLTRAMWPQISFEQVPVKWSEISIMIQGQHSTQRWMWRAESSHSFPKVLYDWEE